MYGSLDDINRTSEAMKRRIAWLNKKNCKTAAELDKYLKEQLKLGVEITRLEVIVAVWKCFENLIRRTPVDTGRLRAGWQFTGDVSDIEWKPPVTYDGYKDQIGFDINRAIQKSIRNSIFGEADALYVFNNVEYLLALNAGWSRKQAGHFIDLFLQELKGELHKVATAKAA